MLNQKTIEIIKSTVPVLEQHGTAITTRFYELLFKNHPELLNVFNHANQRQGRQQTALANAVYAAAAHIDNLEAIIPVVKQIGQKHRALGIKPKHYPIVGETLLAAIKDVLGKAATDEIIEAWAEAYGVIASAFIGVEKEMYEAAESQPGGWKDFRNFIVEKKVKESDVITSFYLKPEDGKAIASYEPGQYITVKVQPEGSKYTHLRHYSLSDAPGKEYYRITVKKETGCGDNPDGVVSSYLHDHVNEGDVLQVSAPAGDFVLDMTKTIPVVLISGGVGLTPMISMLNTLAEKQPEREVTFIHAAINGKVHALKDHVANLTNEHDQMKSFIVYEKPTTEDDNCYHKQGYIDKEWLESVLPKQEADYYFCGPVPFMKAVYSALKELKISEERIHFEFFGPASDITAPQSESVRA